MRTLRAHAIAVSALLLAYLLAICLLHPFSNTLYGGDDWAYAWSVERMVSDGKLIASSWVGAAAVPQVLWGTAFCKLFGLSYRVMNIATMVFAALGPVLVYALGVELGLGSRKAFFAAFFAVINPLYLGFACSFMSDVYYVVLMLGAVLAYLRGLRQARLGLLLLGSVVASVALLQRQIGIATPAALAGTLLLSAALKRRPVRRAIGETVAVTLVPAASVAIFRAFPNAFGGVTITQIVKLEHSVVVARFKDYSQSLSHAYSLLVYIAVFLLPLFVTLLPAFARRIRAISSRGMIATACLFVAASLLAFALALRGKLDFYVVGEFLHIGSLPVLGIGLWKALALAGSLAFPVLLVLFMRTLWLRFAHRSEAKPLTASPSGTDAEASALAQIFLASSLVIHSFFVATFIAFYNNYFLPLVPLALLLTATLVSSDPVRDRRWQWAAASVLGLFELGWSAVNLDVVYRYVEADDRVTDAMIARGIPSEQIFDYAPSYARRHYALADAATQRDPYSTFAIMRGRCKYALVPADTQLPGAFRTWVLSQESYHTLAGDRIIEVRARGAQPRHTPTRKPRR